MWQFYVFIICITGVIIIAPLLKSCEIKKSMKRYNVTKKFVKENKFYGRNKYWNSKRLDNIINFFDSSRCKVFSDFPNYLVVYENKNILIFTPETFWLYIPKEWIQDIKVTRKGTALKGALKGSLVFGKVGAISGADDWEITVHIISKGFENPNYSLTFKNNTDLSNLMYYQYNK